MEVLPGRARLATYAAGGADVAEGDGDRHSPAPIGHRGHQETASGLSLLTL